MELLVALSLLLVLEGLLPALSPRLFRQVLIDAAQMDDRALRVVGLLSMLMGAALLYWVRN